MTSKILDGKARITIYCADFFEPLESFGRDSFPEDNNKRSFRLLCSNFEPSILKKEMRESLSYD